MSMKSGAASKRSLDVTAIFGGIGGFERGLHQAGHQTSLFCESDPDACLVLRARFSNVPIAEDIRRTDKVIGMVSSSSQLLTAGFPCTDLSQAGLTLGFLGGRSSLIRETIDLLRRRPFAHVLIENVPNWRHLHRGSYMTEVLNELEAMGYRWAYRTIDALAFGLPQRRQRLFLYATLEDDPRDVLFYGNATPDTEQYELHEAAHGFYWTEGNRGLGWGENCVPTLKGGSSMGIPSPPAILLPDLSVVTPDVRDAERLQGFSEDWTLAHDADATDRRVNERRRWLLVGNAVNVEVSRWLGRQLASPRAYAGDVGVPLTASDAWPAAAWFDGSRRYSVRVSPWPVRRRRKALADFLRYSGSPLSLRATAGFYSRIIASKLRFKTGFREAIAEHLKRMESESKAPPTKRSRTLVAANAA